MKKTLRDLFKFGGIAFLGLSIVKEITQHFEIAKDNYIPLLIIAGIAIIAMDIYLKEE